MKRRSQSNKDVGAGASASSAPDPVWAPNVDHDYTAMLTALDAIVAAGMPSYDDAGDEKLDVDVVISGGGLRGYFTCGALHVLRRNPRIRIRRIAGTSAGAWCSAFYHCGLTTEMWCHSYLKTKLKLDIGLSLLEAYTEINNESFDMFPPDAHERCSGKVFINITTISNFGVVRNTVVSEFATRDDLIDACMASSSIPYLSTAGLGKRYRGELVVDGGILNNVPVFRDGTRPQIVLRLSSVPYPSLESFAPVDICIEALILRGALEMSQHLQGNGDRTSITLLQPEVAVDVADPNGVYVRAKTIAYYLTLVAVATPFIGCYFLLQRFSSSYRHYLMDKQTVWTRKSKAVITAVVLSVLYYTSPQTRLVFISLLATYSLTRIHKSSGTVPSKVLQVDREHTDSEYRISPEPPK